MLVVIAGCASTTVSNRQILVNEKLPRPNRILVYDFIANPADMPPDSALLSQVTPPSAPPTFEQMQAGRQLGHAIASELAADIQDMGIPAMVVPAGTRPQVGAIVIKGYLLSVDEGSGVKRMVIGFGSGGSELKTAVEGYQMTDRGLRKLGSGTVEAGSNKSPGLVAPAAVAVATGSPIGLIVMGGMKVYGEASGRSGMEGRAKATAKEIADVLRTRFQEQGWIQ